MFKTIIGIERAQQQHRAMTASPRSSLLSATGNGWVPDMQVFRLIPGAAAASARDLPQLRSSPRRSHVACPTSPGSGASTSLLLKDPEQPLLALPAAHGAPSPPPRRGRQSRETWGLKPHHTALPAQPRHVFGAGTRGGRLERKPRQCGRGLGRVPSRKPAAGLACRRPGFAPRPGYCANPPMQVFVAPLPASHKKGLLLASPLPAHGAPQGQEGDRRQVAGTGQAARGGPGEADEQRGYGLVLQHKLEGCGNHVSSARGRKRASSSCGTPRPCWRPPSPSAAQGHARTVSCLHF